jgi:predicted site-specific integrase-resolvase
MNCSQYQSLKTLQKQFDISSSTLRNWVEDGKIAAIRTSGGSVYTQHGMHAGCINHNNSNKINTYTYINIAVTAL